MQTLTQLPWLLGVLRLTTLFSRDRSTGKSWTNPAQHTVGVKEQPPPFLSLLVPLLTGSRRAAFQAAGIGKSLGGKQELWDPHPTAVHRGEQEARRGLKEFVHGAERRAWL